MGPCARGRARGPRGAGREGEGGGQGGTEGRGCDREPLAPCVLPASPARTPPWGLARAGVRAAGASPVASNKKRVQEWSFCPRRLYFLLQYESRSSGGSLQLCAFRRVLLQNTLSAHL